jgi:hypothetical protein
LDWAAGHKDKALEYGKDIWMKHTLPTTHVLYLGIQVKKAKLDAAGATKEGNANIAEVLNQVTMMLGHEIFDPESVSGYSWITLSLLPGARSPRRPEIG